MHMILISGYILALRKAMKLEKNFLCYQKATESLLKQKTNYLKTQTRENTSTD